MAPPLFADLGKSAKDVFGKGYHFGFFKVEGKLKPDSGPEFTANATQTLETGKVGAFLESKLRSKEHGLTFTEKWNTENNLFIELAVEDKIKQGLKVCASGNFSPLSRKFTPLLKAHYKHDRITANGDCSFDGSAPLIQGAVVGAYNGWLLGYQGAFNATQTKLTKSNIALGYDGKDFVVHTHVNDGQEFGGSLFVRKFDNIETGVQLGFCSGTNSPKFAMGCNYKIDSDSSIRAKVNNFAQVGLGFQHKLRPGITLTLSMLFEGKNLNQGGHKVGLALDIEA